MFSSKSILPAQNDARNEPTKHVVGISAPIKLLSQVLNHRALDYTKHHPGGPQKYRDLPGSFVSLQVERETLLIRVLKRIRTNIDR